MRDNIFITSLKKGYDNSDDGISLKKIASDLGIDLSPNSDIAFRVNYCKWFFENFQTESSSNLSKDSYKRDRIKETIDIFGKHNAFLKGESLNKYIDYLELKEARESSKIATIISLVSLLLVVISIILPFIIPNNSTPTKQIIVTNNWYQHAKSELKYSTDTEFTNKNMNNTKRNICGKLDSINNVNKSSKIVK